MLNNTHSEYIDQKRLIENNQPVEEFNGVFGLPNLDKLNLHLKNPEYQENAKIQPIEAGMEIKK